jgi:hypothetical protein
MMAVRLSVSQWSFVVPLLALGFGAGIAPAATTYTYYGNAYNSCGGAYCTGGPYALSIEFTTTLTGSALANLPFTDITSTITSFRFTDESGLTLYSNNASFKEFHISTNTSGNIVTWLTAACGATCNIQMQTNWESPSGFIPGADFSETSVSFTGSYGFIGSDPGTWSSSTGLTTYTYRGNHFTSASAPYTTSDSITGFLTTYPLAGNLTGVDITSNVFNFSFTATVDTLTPLNTGFPIPVGATGGPRFVVSTDSQGNIISWDVTLIEAVAPPNNYALFTCNGISTYFNSCSKNPYDWSYEGNGRISGMVDSDPGTWSSSPAVAFPATEITTTASGLLYSRVTKTYNGTVTITNISGGALAGPFLIVLTSVTPGVILTNAVRTVLGDPYITPGVNGLESGQSVTVGVEFSNPSNAIITFTPVIY